MLRAVPGCNGAAGVDGNLCYYNSRNELFADDGFTGEVEGNMGLGNIMHDNPIALYLGAGFNPSLDSACCLVPIYVDSISAQEKHQGMRLTTRFQVNREFVDGREDIGTNVETY